MQQTADHAGIALQATLPTADTGCRCVRSVLQADTQQEQGLKLAASVLLENTSLLAAPTARIALQVQSRTRAPAPVRVFARRVRSAGTRRPRTCRRAQHVRRASTRQTMAWRHAPTARRASIRMVQGRATAQCAWPARSPTRVRLRELACAPSVRQGNTRWRRK